MYLTAGAGRRSLCTSNANVCRETKLQHFRAALLAFLVFACTNLAAAPQVFPARPITFVVPFAAGGPADAIARIMAERMQGSLGQPIIIENMGAAAGSIAVGRVAHAAPDGYTLSIGPGWATH